MRGPALDLLPLVCDTATGRMQDGGAEGRFAAWDLHQLAMLAWGGLAVHRETVAPMIKQAISYINAGRLWRIVLLISNFEESEM